MEVPDLFVLGIHTSSDIVLQGCGRVYLCPCAAW